MNRKYFILVLLIISVLVLSACKKSGAAAGAAPRTPFIGGTAGISMNFEKDSPPPEVTDDQSFAFNAIVSLKNEGEYAVDNNDMRVNLVGFDPSDFGKDFESLRDAQPDDILDSKKRDAEGNIIEGTTTFVSFPKDDDNFIPSQFPGNTPFTFRADACYYYETQSNTKLCILKDMINIRDSSLCRPTQARVSYSSSAPVQVLNFREAVVGKDRVSFSFDVVLSGNVDIFWSKDERRPSSGFDAACPRDPRSRREVENKVGIEITEVPNDPVITNLKCGGLDNDWKGVITLVSGRRTITCTADLVSDRVDLEKVAGVKLMYNVLDSKETQVLVKHLAQTVG